VLSCLGLQVNSKILEILQNYPSELHAIILDKGRDILLRFVDRTHVNVESAEVKASDINECLTRLERLWIHNTNVLNVYCLSRLYSNDATPPVSKPGHRRLHKHMLSDVQVSTTGPEVYNVTLRIARYIPSAPILLTDLVASIFGVYINLFFLYFSN